MPTKTAEKKTAKTEETQGFTAEAIPHPVDESAARHQAALADLSKPGRASKADAEQIDNDPGYSKDQLAHMREYWGVGADSD